MQWKDSDDGSEAIDQEADAYYEEEYSPLGVKTGAVSHASQRFGAWILWVPALVVILIILYLFLPVGKDTAATTRVKEIEARLDLLEKRMLTIEGVGERVTQIEKNIKNDGTVETRLENLQTSIAKRMDQVDKELIQLRKKIDAQASKKPAAQAGVQHQESAVSKTSTAYHVVEKGDTLYSIGRRYGISVNRLRQINNLGSNSVIHVGQKLTVK